MSDINVIVNDEIVNIDVIDEPVLVNVVNSPGVPGAPGQGVPVGGTTGQVLAKNSNTNYDTEWVDVTGGAWGTITGTLSNQTDLQNALNAKVPYTGATTNVNLGEYEIKAGQVTLDTSPTGTAAVGTTRWNDTTGLTETTLKGGSVILKNGVDLVARVVNKVSPNTTLTKAAYQAVRVSGAQGQRLAVALAQANNDANSADTIGLVIETIATNQEGFIMTVGQLENINTTGSLQGETWVDGDVLYLSPTTAGAITKVKPTGNGHIVVIGYVEYAHANNGKIYVKVMNGWELDELHDVAIVTPLNNEALIYESATALWKNKSIATALGYTPANAATTLTINGVTYDLSANRTWTISTGITGSGAAGQVSYWDGTTSQAGSNNLFWDNANGRLGVKNNTPVYEIDLGGATKTTNSIVNVASDSPRRAGFSVDNGSEIRYFGGYIGSTTYNEASGEVLVGSPAGYRVAFGVGSTVKARLYNTGNLVLQNGGTFTDGGQRLQVQGTTLLNGNVTFSSATGMTWDATNSRLGIGTNAPTYPLHIRTSSRFGFAYECTDDTANQNYLFLYRNSATPAANDGIGTILLEGNNSSLVRSTYAYFGGRIITSTAGSHSGELYFATTNGGTEADKLVIKPTGNVLIQNGGTFTDSGERLQVTGTMKVTGSSSIGDSSAVVTFITGYNNTIRENRINLYQTNTNIRGINAGGQGWILSKATGTSDLYPTALFAIDSTTQGFLPPRMTTTQKNAITSPAAGLVVYDTTLNKLCVYTTAWETITSA
jgi:nitrogen fixation protein